jgi:hypothetical protein
MTLDQFIKEERDLLVLFEIFWRKQHEANPEHYPLNMAKENAGLWYEMFHTFTVEDAEKIGVTLPIETVKPFKCGDVVRFKLKEGHRHTVRIVQIEGDQFRYHNNWYPLEMVEHA